MNENESEIETLDLNPSTEQQQPEIIKEPLEVNAPVNTSAKPPKKKNKMMIVAAVLCVLIVCALIVVLFLFGRKKEEKGTIKKDKEEVYSEYRMSGNSLENFDLSFLKLENGDKNIIYSPLSIKYALEMLGEGANGVTKSQIDAVIGDYQAKKYENSANMSFANAMFIRDSFKENVKDTYQNKLATKYNAELVFDTFQSPEAINRWVNEKTLGQINNLVDDVSGNQFFLLNALAIDMEWENLIQAAVRPGVGGNNLYSVRYNHENYSEMIMPIEDDNYKSLSFDNNRMNVRAVEIGASINRYDILKELGKDNIRDTITKEYTEWLENEKQARMGSEYGISDLTPVNEYVDQFVKELSENYNRVDGSTDFLLYNDEDVKAFAKDLKQYNGTTLQYVGIMPQTKDINTYIQEMDSKNMNSILENLKEIKLENFAEGKVTKIIGSIPLFNFDYTLNLMEDLKTLGIKEIFDSEKADFSNMTSSQGTSIDKTIHKANITFSNEGIKAAAATAFGGFGAAGGGFEHLYEVPVETIDLTFDKPYIFLIRDKASGEVWFAGKVYQPLQQ